MSEKIEVGTILECSWGYDQTNVDFYQVTRTTDKMAILKKLKSKLVNGEEGFMTGYKTCTKDDFTPDSTEIKKKIKTSDGRDYIMISKFEFADVWDGSPQRCSWYA